jgi:hypothetical protein
MTLPDERFRAVRWARSFLQELQDPKKTPGVSQIVRQQALSILRHYPSDQDMMAVTQTSPEIFQTHMEPVTRMLKQWQGTKPKISLPKQPDSEQE